jgi:creatinine amidohydrolase
VRFHNWWNAPKTWAHVQRIDPAASHASWMENFPWTRLPGVTMPTGAKPVVDYAKLQMSSPAQVRELVGDGNYHGLYERPDHEVLALWETAVQETRSLIEGGW